MFKKYIYYLIFIACCFYLLQACFQNSKNSEAFVSDSEYKISYNFDIRPILSDKCFACHGPDPKTREAGLRLDIAKDAYQALKETPTAHAIVPGNPSLSEVFKRISSKDTSLLMPPPNSNLKLTIDEIDLIEKWIAQGAKYEKHWAFQAPIKPAIPQVSNNEWPRNKIDYFILSKLERKKLTPNEEADKERLLKRVSLDITGLPPTLSEMDNFLADNSSMAYERVVDRLLKSPRYGEKMAVYWLDVARYADSHGYQDDSYRSQWPWRDWVIHAFNKNYSYKKFVTWQVAGDLLPQGSREALLATGFNRNHKITEEGGVVDEEYRIEYVTDRANTFSKAFLAATIECSHCHDHKYDPFSQKEHYQLSAFFNNVKEKGLESMVGGPETFAKTPYMTISNEEVKSILKFINKPDNSKLIVSVMGDNEKPRKTFILNRGAYDAPGEEVQAGTPKAILPYDNKLAKNRLGLTEWLFDPKNPLTARVLVNNLWQEFFGVGIVKSSGDFGMQGDLPSHPQLLDWLAVDFMEHNWNMKRLIKQFVMSATYRQSATITPEHLAADPENVLLARSSRNRLQAEFVRDMVLASSGLLTNTIGGPSVKPYQPAGIWEATTSGRGVLSTYLQDKGANLYRRGTYSFIKRTSPPVFMSIFDASNRDVCEVNRSRTNTPLQALVMMNDPMVLEASRVLAAKLIKENKALDAQIQTAFRLIVCRKPNEKELQILQKFYHEVSKETNPKNAQKLLQVGDYPIDKTINSVKLSAMMQLISAIYNLEESITRS